ncbi:hypothetical protein DASC09_061550 [Saccharomycopsis crataegensis]|uniref:Conserved oligomeric Golgi complex subunit 2 n=1 Tax=Saccharomycopsis crataegensis TaxID=43959 RepID=A0AAV5QVS9_9ASCO|nr:hypothetical protein DASC09_061550 [Saccharomycopsis crataegensis]
MTSAQNSVFDILDGTDEFPLLNKVSKDSFAVGLDSLLDNLDSNNNDDSLIDSFNPDQFLYKNFRFISLADLNSELTRLHESLDRELFDLVNDDYHDFVKLATSLNNNTFVSLVSNIRLSVANYHVNINSQQSAFTKDFETVDRAICFKKKLDLTRSMLEKILLLHRSLDIFEKLVVEHSTINGNDVDLAYSSSNENIISNSSTDSKDPFEVILESQATFGEGKDLDLKVIKEMASLYLSTHILEQYLTEKVSGASKATNDKEFLEIPDIEESFKTKDVLENIQKLNKLTLKNLLQPSTSNPNGDEMNEEDDDVYHNSDDDPTSVLKTSPFLSAQFRRANKVHLEFRAIVDEYLKKLVSGKKKSLDSAVSSAIDLITSPTDDLVEVFGNKKSQDADLKKTFLELKSSLEGDGSGNELLELMGIYLIIGCEEEFIKILKK